MRSISPVFAGARLIIYICRHGYKIFPHDAIETLISALYHCYFISLFANLVLHSLSLWGCAMFEKQFQLDYRNDKYLSSYTFCVWLRLGSS